MATIAQLIAVTKGAKAAATRDATAAYHTLQKVPPFIGIIKTYQPRDDEGETLPGERLIVQESASKLLRAAFGAWAPWMDAEATLNESNQHAMADVVVDGNVILAQVPVTTLMFLTKRLEDVRVFVQKMPTLPPEERWEYDPDLGVHRTAGLVTARSKKVPRNHVKAEATDKHPAQVELYYEDVVVGDWTTVKLSGALPVRERNKLIERIDALLTAVATARERANSTTVVVAEVAAAVSGFLLSTREPG